MAISQITSESIAANTVVVADLGPITYLNSGAGNSFYIQANNNTALYIDDRQEVGIGTTSPIAKLHVYTTGQGTDGVSIQSSTAGSLHFAPNTSGGSWNSLVSSGDQVIQFSSGTQNKANLCIVPWFSGTSGIRITANGSIGFNTGTPGGSAGQYSFAKTLTGAPTTHQILSWGAIQPDVTSSSMYATYPSTSAASFTLNDLQHYSASLGTIGSGSTITSQMGFFAQSTLIGATNNYGFYSAIASGTGRYNFYAGGTAANYFAGDVGIGSSSPVAKLQVNGSSSDLDVLRLTTNVDAATQQYVGIGFGPGTPTHTYPAAAIRAEEYDASDSRTNLVFYTRSVNSDVAPTEVMRIDNAGRLGVGTSSLTAYVTRIGKTIDGATSAFGVALDTTIASSVTTQAIGYQSRLTTKAAAFTLTDINHFYCSQPTLGATSAVTNQVGYRVDSSLIGATINYGFYSAIASGTGRYNFYAGGTAANYFAGSVGIGTTALSNFNLNNNKDITGGLYAYAYNTSSAIQSDVTTVAVGYNTYLKTATTSFTLASLQHFAATQATFGSGSTVTSQYGYVADSSLAGATNNYGFFSNIASGSGRWNFYAAGTADNYFNGNIYSRNLLLQGDSTNAYIRPTNTGNLYLGANNANILALSKVANSTNAALQDTDVGVNFFIQNLNSTTNSRYPSLIIQNYTGSTLSSGFPVVELQTARGSSSSLLSVISGQILGGFNTWGHNGAGFQSATRIQGYAANTFSTAVSAGLQFLTTLSGTQSEAVRIDEYGRVGIGGLPYAGVNLRISKNMGGFGGTTGAWGVTSDGTIQSDVTVQANYFLSTLSSAATTFTLAAAHHYRTYQVTLGAGSTITNQYGFSADSTLTGATNNYGFLSNIPSGTGRWNFYASGSASNYMAGPLYLGYNYYSNVAMGIGYNSGTTNGTGIYIDTLVSSTTTGHYVGHSSYIGTGASAFTLSNLSHYLAGQAPIGAGSTLTNQYGFRSEGSMVGATNNYGFYSNIASGTNRWNFYAAGTADNYFAGNVFIGGANNTTTNGNFTNAFQSAVVSTNASTKSFDSTYQVATSNASTVDVWLCRDGSGNVFGTNTITGHFYIYVTGASGVNAFSAVYSIVTTGNGTLQATLTSVSSTTRGTSPVSSVSIANDGANGAIKLQITYINNSAVVTGGTSSVTFKGVVR